MKDDKKELISMLRRRLIALKKASDSVQERDLIGEIKRLIELLDSALS